MKYLLLKDKRKRKNFANQEKRKKILRYCVQNQKLRENGKKQAFLCAQQLYSLFDKRKYDGSNVKNRCIISFRGKAVYRKYALGRSFLKQFILSGLIPGLRKAS